MPCLWFTAFRRAAQSRFAAVVPRIIRGTLLLQKRLALI